MEKKEVISLNPIIHGVQCVLAVGKQQDNPLDQKYLLIRDADDRRSGTGIKKYGLCGGGIENTETPYDAMVRELYEELALRVHYLEPCGSFEKTRPNGFTNKNFLFFSWVPESVVLQTNDPKEVSQASILTLGEIIDLYEVGHFHEGSIRLLFNFLKDIRHGSLNDPAEYLGYKF